MRRASAIPKRMADSEGELRVIAKPRECNVYNWFVNTASCWAASPVQEFHDINQTANPASLCGCPLSVLSSRCRQPILTALVSVDSHLTHRSIIQSRHELLQPLLRSAQRTRTLPSDSNLEWRTGEPDAMRPLSCVTAS